MFVNVYVNVKIFSYVNNSIKNFTKINYRLNLIQLQLFRTNICSLTYDINRHLRTTLVFDTFIQMSKSLNRTLADEENVDDIRF